MRAGGRRAAAARALLRAAPAPALLLAAAPAVARAGELPARPTREAAWIARVVAPARARATPGGRVVMRLATEARWNGGPVALLVLGARRDADGGRWLRVLLPRRPTGATGWVSDERVRLRRTPWRVEVSLRARVLRLLRAGRTVLRTRVVVGAPATPTPTGLFAVRERIPQPDPSGFYGPWVLQLTAFSSVLERYDGGDGAIGVHGRDGASLLDPPGSARSHGCVRVPDAVVRVLARRAPEGTPVRIRR
jgi:lipoprotein-anchoring transpeptidase ErfK/SrfK